MANVLVQKSRNLVLGLALLCYAVWSLASLGLRLPICTVGDGPNTAKADPRLLFPCWGSDETLAMLVLILQLIRQNHEAENGGRRGWYLIKTTPSSLGALVTHTWVQE